MPGKFYYTYSEVSGGRMAMTLGNLMIFLENIVNIAVLFLSWMSCL